MAEPPPLELVVLDFPAPDVPKSLEAEMHRLTFIGDLRVLEAVVVAKNLDGSRIVLDVTQDLSNAEPPYTPPEPAVLVPTEVDAIGEALMPGRTALAMVIEHAWIRNLREVFRSARGTVLLSVVLDSGGPPSPATSDEAADRP